MSRVVDATTGEDITDRHDIEHGCNGITLQHALRQLGLPTSGSKRVQAQRLVEAGLTVDQVLERYGWRARRPS